VLIFWLDEFSVDKAAILLLDKGVGAGWLHLENSLTAEGATCSTRSDDIAYKANGCQDSQKLEPYT